MAPACARWVKPEVYPLIAAVGTAVGFSGFAMFRTITSHPDVRVKKSERIAGMAEKQEEGKHYFIHPVRKYVNEKRSGIFGLNKTIAGTSDAHKDSKLNQE